jgi:hypothetical protein
MREPRVDTRMNSITMPMSGTLSRLSETRSHGRAVSNEA